MYSCNAVSENGGSRPSSITRSSRESFACELQMLPSESIESYYELNEEVLDVEDVSDDDHLIEPAGEQIESIKIMEDEVVDETDIVNRNEAKRAESTSSVESELDAKIRKGLEKVKKLDEILNEKIEKEKEAKRLRRALEREFQSQVAELIKEKGADKVCGSQQLLYLCATSDRSEDMEGNDVIESIFPTQIDSEYYKDKYDGITKSNPKSVNSSENGPDAVTSDTSENKSKKGKDFVKRNIQLASQAQELISLTEEERKRLDELLSDDSDLLLVDNPFSVPCISISGYQFSNEELISLEDIDVKLKELVPIIGDSQLNEGENLSESQSNEIDDSRSADDDETSSRRTGEIFIPEGKCGEHVLQEGHDERTVAYRLRNIEEKLAQLQCDEEGVGSQIDPDLIRKLLDVDSRLTSDSISICDSLRSRSILYNDIDTRTECSDIGSAYDAQFDVTVN